MPISIWRSSPKYILAESISHRDKQQGVIKHLCCFRHIFVITGACLQWCSLRDTRCLILQAWLYHTSPILLFTTILSGRTRTSLTGQKAKDRIHPGARCGSSRLQKRFVWHDSGLDVANQRWILTEGRLNQSGVLKCCWPHLIHVISSPVFIAV